MADFMENSRQILDVLEADPELAKLFDSYPTNAEWRAETGGLKMGHIINEM